MGSVLESALLNAWSEFPVVKSNKRNEFAKFNYADLPKILGEIRPFLVKNGIRLSFDQKNLGEELDTVQVKACVTHAESGEYKESEWLGFKVKAKKSGADPAPQDLMSMVTYLKRYSVLGLLGIITDDTELEETNAEEFGNKQDEPKAYVKPVERAPIVPAGPSPIKASVEVKNSEKRKQYWATIKQYCEVYGEQKVLDALDITDFKMMNSWDDKKLNDRMIDLSLSLLEPKKT